jgi:S1-C subfamily serine protease
MGTVMDDIMILDAVERYIRGEMNPDERLHFENLRKTNPEIDQLVVEHTLFLQQMNRFGEWKKFHTALHDIHTDLAEQGKIKSARLKGKAKLVYLWKRYQRVAAIAASIAGVTTVSIIALVWSLTPTNPNRELQNLDRKLKVLENRTNLQDKEINNVKNKVAETSIPYKTGGTSFLIDPKGYLVTNAHVVQNGRNIAVQNNKGDNYNARVAYMDLQRDIAILKIDDTTFKALHSIPYTFNKSSVDLAEPLFTLGYPRNEIVYGEGYLSSKTGYNGDTLTCQIEVAANPGNSGGPVLNKNGEIVGLLSTRQKTAEGVVFATRTKYIFMALEEMRSKDTTHAKIKLPANSLIRGLERTQQVSKVSDYVFMVKVN